MRVRCDLELSEARVHAGLFSVYPAALHRFEANGEPMTCELWRQDDNGNRFLVGIFLDRAAAEARLAELTRTLHKQTYWICDREGE